MKDTAVLLLPAAGVLFAYAAWQTPRPLRSLASLLAVFLAFGLPWQIRDFLLTGNPLFPESIGKATLGAQGSLAAVAHRYLTMPWNVLFHAIPFFESPLQMPLGVSLLMLVPVWLLGPRPRVTSGEQACLSFAFLYFVCAAWFPDRSLRYIAAPLLVVVVLTGCRALRLWREAVHATRGPLFAGLAYCLVFALCGIMIIEINAPQLRLFAGRIDCREYLREAYYPYAPLEFLSAHAKPGDWIYSAGNCAIAYSPDPARFNCILTPGGRYDFAQIRRDLANRPYRFLLVTAGALEAAAAAPGDRPVYRDAHFVVFERAGR